MLAIKEIVRCTPALYAPVRRYHQLKQNLTIALSEYQAKAAVFSCGSERLLESPSVVIDRVSRKLAQRGACWPQYITERKLRLLLLIASNGWEYSSLFSDLQREFCIECFSLESLGIERHAGDRTRAMVNSALIDFFAGTSQKFDLVISYLSGSDIDGSTIEMLKSKRVPVFSFHWDDRLLFKGRREDGVWSGPHSVATSYDLNLTNAPLSIPKYQHLGAEALFWPEAAFHRESLYEAKRDIPVLFIGSKYGVREQYCKYLKRAGIDLHTYGAGWSNGHISEEEVVALTARSHIVLGMGYIGHSSYQCLKGRDFEVPMSGGLLLTSYHSDLDLVYDLGEEILVYRNVNDCLSMIRWYLDHPGEANRIRQRGREAAVMRHSWCLRLRQLLDAKCFSYR